MCKSFRNSITLLGKINHRACTRQNFPARLKHKDGHIVDVEITSSAIYSDDKQFLGMEGLFRDVSEQVVIKEKLHRLATIDELIGILNRRAFLEKASHARRD